jgi:hypothetical protein
MIKSFNNNTCGRLMSIGLKARIVKSAFQFGAATLLGEHEQENGASDRSQRQRANENDSSLHMTT